MNVYGQLTYEKTVNTLRGTLQSTPLQLLVEGHEENLLCLLRMVMFSPQSIEPKVYRRLKQCQQHNLTGACTEVLERDV
jgi:hypothetical protein